MARKKIPDNETADDRLEREIKDTISNHASRSEKTSWNRKMDNMVSLMARITPIEQQIIDLQAEKMPIFDEIQELRNMMVNECIHPHEYLVVEEDHVVCKFCNKKLNRPK